MAQVLWTSIAKTLSEDKAQVLHISSADSGTTTTIIDESIPTAYPDDSLVGKYVVFMSGDNIGESARITDYGQTYKTITIESAPNSVASGDAYAIISDYSAELDNNISSIDSDISSIDSDVSELMTDIGDFSADTNNASLKSKLSFPDSDSATLYDYLVTGFDSSELSADRYGSVVEMVKDVANYLKGGVSVYPTMDDGVELTADSDSWTLGSITNIVPSSTISHDIVLRGVILESISENTTYEVVLYEGAEGSESEIARKRFASSSNISAFPDISIISDVISADSRISAALATASSSADTVTISLEHAEA